MPRPPLCLLGGPLNSPCGVCVEGGGEKRNTDKRETKNKRNLRDLCSVRSSKTQKCRQRLSSIGADTVCWRHGTDRQTDSRV